MNHTPTPWQLSGITTERLQGHQKSIEADFIHLEAEGYTAGGGIGLIHNKPNGVGMDNARFILTACNAHQELVAALQAILDGNTMVGRENWSHADVIQEHYKIARKALTAIKKGD